MRTNNISEALEEVRVDIRCGLLHPHNTLDRVNRILDAAALQDDIIEINGHQFQRITAKPYPDRTD